MPTDATRLSKALADFERRVSSLERGGQLGRSSFVGGIDEYDEDGNLVGRTGEQFDGSHGSVPLSGPTPPRPTAPILTPAPGGLTVTWDGEFVGDLVPDAEEGTREVVITPVDFSRVEVHVGTTPGFYTGSAVSLRATIETPRGGDAVIVPMVKETKYVVLVTRSIPGKASAPSEEVSGEPGSVITDAEAAEIKTSVAEAEAAAADALTKASAAETTANGKGRVYFQTTAPTGTLSTSDLWFDTDNENAPHRWDGTTWVLQPLGNAAIGNLDAGRITTGYLAADRIEANSITAAKIATDQILARHIAANQITASKILAGEIVGTHIRAGEILADHIKSGQITAEKLSAQAIDGKTITGVNIQGSSVTSQASNGSRIVLSPSTLHGTAQAMHLYGTSGQPAKVYADGHGSLGMLSGYDNLSYAAAYFYASGRMDVETYGTDGSGGVKFRVLPTEVRTFTPLVVNNSHTIRGIRAGRSEVTTDSNGYATITHNMNHSPTGVTATGAATTGASIAWTIVTDSWTSTTFRIRVLNNSGGVVANTIIPVGWIVFAA